MTSAPWSFRPLSRRLPELRPVLRLLARYALGAGVAWLVLLHGLLLWRRLADPRLWTPAVAGRWLATLLLLVVLWRLRRLGVPLYKGRRAAIVWLLVLLVHVQVPGAPAGFEADPPAAGIELLALVPAAMTVAALGALLRLAWRRRGATGRRAAVPVPAWADRAPIYPRRALFFPCLACRPPPRAA